jgi:dynein heavy chain 1, cytosolic
MRFRMGGNPFGPAGTGKTESVKALGAQLGRFVLVFNCDESFDYSAMGRLFAGLCQVRRSVYYHAHMHANMY